MVRSGRTADFSPCPCQHSANTGFWWNASISRRLHELIQTYMFRPVSLSNYWSFAITFHLPFLVVQHIRHVHHLAPALLVFHLKAKAECGSRPLHSLLARFNHGSRIGRKQHFHFREGIAPNAVKAPLSPPRHNVRISPLQPKTQKTSNRL